jgi:3',5'-cyclic AMP phosphodiesterase CpdA
MVADRASGQRRFGRTLLSGSGLIRLCLVRAGRARDPLTMHLLIHLSDLHMARDPATQSTLFTELVKTLGRERDSARTDSVGMVITGDVFASATQPHGRAVDEFLRLHGRMVEALGGDAPTIVLPGNHDRRALGLLGPNRGKLFRALRAAADPSRMFVAGCSAPYLAEVVPGGFHRLPAHVIAYDSTYLPGGLVGAGGTLRLEDLLMASAGLPDDGRPVLLLTHHHLIPTPLTDISHIDSSRGSRIVRWIIRSVLPALVSYGDREELTMTALGAGTVLSTLHTFRRPILLLHGHKHVPTARLVAGMTEDCGDVLIASAGSGGTRERVHAARHPDAARLWPSFNLLRLSDTDVRIESIGFSPKPTPRPPVRRQLASARRDGPKWRPEPVSFRVKDPSPRVELDEATYTLAPSVVWADRWDLRCVRRVELRDGATVRRYVEFVRASPIFVGARGRRREKRRVEIATSGFTRYEVPGALARTRTTRSSGTGAAFEWVGLLCRYGAIRATLRLAHERANGVDPFGSVTDLTIGRERPVRLIDADGHWTLTAEGCAPRSLLRIYWPITRPGVSLSGAPAQVGGLPEALSRAEHPVTD